MEATGLRPGHPVQMSGHPVEETLHMRRVSQYWMWTIRPQTRMGWDGNQFVTTK